MLPAGHNDIAALEHFLTGNDDLERLEALLVEFNVFEAVGVVRQELRHSDFLSFLLDPQQPHGLGDSFAKRFIQQAVSNATLGSLPLRPVDVALMDLSGMAVRREWQNIDVLLLDERNRLAVVIENKVGSGEHSDQLSRYLGVVGKWFPRHQRVGIYLTPDGNLPSNRQFAPLAYGAVCQLVEREAQRQGLSVEVSMVLRHYAQMLRRNVVNDSEIAGLCRRIYNQHKHAIDLIIRWRQDTGTVAGDLIHRWVSASPGLVPDESTPLYVRFAPSVWDGHAALLTGSGFTSTHRMLVFEFWTEDCTLRLKLGSGPEQVRQHLIRSFVDADCDLIEQESLAVKWPRLYHRYLAPMGQDELGHEAWEEQMRASWEDFVSSDLPVLVDLVNGIQWPVE